MLKPGHAARALNLARAHVGRQAGGLYGGKPGAPARHAMGRLRGGAGEPPGPHGPRPEGALRAGEQQPPDLLRVPLNVQRVYRSGFDWPVGPVRFG